MGYMIKKLLGLLMISPFTVIIGYIIYFIFSKATFEDFILLLYICLPIWILLIAILFVTGIDYLLD